MARIISCDDHSWKFCGFVYVLAACKELLRPVWSCLRCREVKAGPYDMDKSFNIIVLLGEDFTDYKFLKKKLDKLTMLRTEVMVFSISTKLPGRTMEEKWALSNWWSIAKWIEKKDMKSWTARKLLHKQMVRKAHAVVLFWDGLDRVIEDVVKRAKKRKLPIREYLC